MMVGDTRAVVRAVDERLLRAVGEVTTCESALDGRVTAVERSFHTSNNVIRDPLYISLQCMHISISLVVGL